MATDTTQTEKPIKTKPVLTTEELDRASEALRLLSIGGLIAEREEIRIIARLNREYRRATRLGL